LVRSTYELWQCFFALPDAAKRRYAGSPAERLPIMPFGVKHAKAPSGAPASEH
jgi:hypothetical protein